MGHLHSTIPPERPRAARTAVPGEEEFAEKDRLRLERFRAKVKVPEVVQAEGGILWGIGL